ncbi:MAG TPA: hypothetical protein VHR97_14695 [Candidatus Baltobacteraceae bacterium]|jgi:hypothetical protein|nr:hypothetical protein [Candidatus Baltobacteraceae bacterium]
MNVVDCRVCGLDVEIDVDYSYDGSRTVTAPMAGKSEQCEDCLGYVHPECLAPKSTFCRTCEEAAVPTV